jgi:hypothetical protein
LMVWLNAVPEPGTELVGEKANFWLAAGPCQKVGRRTKLTNKQGLECTAVDGSEGGQRQMRQDCQTRADFDATRSRRPGCRDFKPGLAGSTAAGTQHTRVRTKCNPYLVNSSLASAALASADSIRQYGLSSPHPRHLLRWRSNGSRWPRRANEA